MEKMEFIKLQDEMGSYLYEYERFLKEGHIIDMKFTFHFYDLLEEQYTITSENALLTTLCAKLNDKVALADIDAFILSSKKDYNLKLVSYRNKNNNAKNVINSLDNVEYTKELEEYFKEYCLKDHPAVKIMITKLERMTFDELRIFYLNNNLQSYTALYDLQKESIRPCMLTEEQYQKACDYYNKTKNDIANEMEKKLSEYPYIKKDAFEDDITIAREKAEIIVALNKQKAMNKALHQEVIKLYGEDVKITN